MTDALQTLESIRRPRLLIRTARIGVSDYRRNPHLHRLLGPSSLPRNAVALARLIEMEQDLDVLRLSNAASYSISRHIEVLVAMMGEAQLLRAAAPEMPAAPVRIITVSPGLDPIAIHRPVHASVHRSVHKVPAAHSPLTVAC